MKWVKRLFTYFLALICPVFEREHIGLILRNNRNTVSQILKILKLTMWEYWTTWEGS